MTMLNKGLRQQVNSRDTGQKYENPDALSGPSSPCYPHSRHNQGEKYPAVLISMEYLSPSIHLPGAKFLNLQNHFPPDREGVVIRYTFHGFSGEGLGVLLRCHDILNV